MVLALRSVRGAEMTEVQAADVLVILEDLRRMVELTAWSVFLATAFVIGGVLHRWTRGS